MRDSCPNSPERIPPSLRTRRQKAAESQTADKLQGSSPTTIQEKRPGRLLCDRKDIETRTARKLSLSKDLFHSPGFEAHFFPFLFCNAMVGEIMSFGIVEETTDDYVEIEIAAGGDIAYRAGV